MPRRAFGGAAPGLTGCRIVPTLGRFPGAHVSQPRPDPTPVLPRAARAGRVVEAFLLFALIPGLLATRLIRMPLLPLLWAASLYCFWRLRLDGGFNLRSLGEARAAPGEWRRMLLRFLLVAGLLTALVGSVRPGLLFAFPLRRPWNWALLLGLYPPLSVFPQEVIYRAFFFNRYQFLFGKGKWLLLGSSFAFGITHLAFHNWVAVALTVPGGLLFGHSYRRNPGLLFVTCEHALYGCLLFTIGLGGFLMEGVR